MTGVKVGLVCPYSFDVPGGVQGHVAELARTLIELGHQVSVLAPADDDPDEAGELPDFVVPAGRSVGIPYNGSVARLSFGPVSYARVRRWIRAGEFDVLHVHEPVAPSLSMLALMVADGPIVATFHTANPRSRMLTAFQGVLQPFMEKITGRIAVSELARQVQVEHLGGDAVVIPNGVDVGFFAAAEAWPRVSADGRHHRFHRSVRRAPQGGWPCCWMRCGRWCPTRPELELVVAGSGEQSELIEMAGWELGAAITDAGAGCRTRRRRRCCTRSTCTAHPIPVARVSG